MTYKNRPPEFIKTISGLRSHAYELASATPGITKLEEVLKLAKEIFDWLVEEPKEK